MTTSSEEERRRVFLASLIDDVAERLGVYDVISKMEILEAVKKQAREKGLRNVAAGDVVKALTIDC